MKGLYKIQIAVALAAMSMFAACSTQEIPLYTAGQYIQFESIYTDSVTVSFTQYPGKQDVEFPVLVNISGTALKADLPYSVEVDSKLTTASESSFSLPKSPVFHAGQYVDTCWITLHNTPELETEEKRIVLRLKDNDNFLQGQAEYTVSILRVNNKLSRPDWWTRNPVEWYYLGTYSDLKYQKFIEATGVADLTGATAADFRYYSLLFKRWLKAKKAAGETVYEANGSEMYVEVIGE